MRSISNEEKGLKRYLKNHMSLNVESMVKFLITGTVALSLTACGGGGGGGSSDSSNSNGENTTVTQSKISDKDGDILLSSKSSIEIVEGVTLEVKGDKSIAAHISGAARSEVKLTNLGTIKVSGDKSIGILADKNAIAINEGNIIGKSGVIDKVQTETEIDENEYSGTIYKEIYTTYKKYDWVEGMRAESGAKAINNKNINIDGFGVGMIADNANLVNNGKITVTSGDQKYKLEWFEDDKLEGDEVGDSKEYVAGMIGINNSKIENGENGSIVLKGEGDGMFVENSSTAVNKGSIEVISEEISGIYRYKGYFDNESGEFFEDEWTEVEEEYWTEVVGMLADENSTAINEGTIMVKNSGIGMIAEDGSIAINNKEIIVSTNQSDYYSKGMEILRNSKGENNGLIKITGDGGGFIGVSVEEGGSFINGKNGVIEVIASDNQEYANAVGILAVSYGENGPLKTTAINEGEITVVSKYGRGMKSEGEYSEIYNSGTINVDGENAVGMQVYKGLAVNTGVINVGKDAATAMEAYGDGAKIINKGTINIDKDNNNNYEENGILRSAMIAENGAVLENSGVINSNSGIDIKTSSGGAYIIGTSKDGSYGKISAKSINIDGALKISTEIAKGSYEESYKLDEVLSADEIIKGSDLNVSSTSVFYDANLKENELGNIDATLVKNSSKISQYVESDYVSVANIFDKYINSSNYNLLEEDGKKVIDIIFEKTSLEDIENGSLAKGIADLTPTIYSNLGRQMLETTETFKAQDLVSINSLGENSYNFTFIGEYRDVDSRKGIEGYESKLTGFVGAMNFGDGTFGTIGYGHNKLDYTGNGDGKIETIHLGLNRFMSYSGLDLRVGLGGEYNFHENKRDVEILSRKAESDFDSYGVNASVEISKKLGEKTYLKPFLGLDLSHMKYDSFSEKGAKSANVKVESESYTSVTPKAGALVGGAFGGLDVYASAHYSYELGDMEKDTMFSYEGFDGKARLVGDELESGITSLKAGANYKMNSFVVGGAIGKNFGRRDNAFMNVSLGYTF